MKKLIVFLVLILTIIPLFSQEEQFWYRASDYKNFVNKEGAFLELPIDFDPNMTRFQYSSVYREFEGSFAVIGLSYFQKEREYNGKKVVFTQKRDYLINKSGEVIIDFTSMDISIVDKLSDGLIGVKRDNKLGFINTAGEWIIEPKYEYSHITPMFSENRAVVQKDGKWFLIDKDDNIINTNVIPQQFWYNKFYEGLARVSKAGTGRFPEYGYVDLDGNLKIPVQFSDARSFSEGVAAVRERGLGKWYFIDHDGKIVDEIPKSAFLSDFIEGLSIIQNNGKVGYINHSGEIVIPCEYDYVSSFTEGYAAVTLNEPMLTGDLGMQIYTIDHGTEGVYGIIDKEGNMVIEPQYYGIPEIKPGGVAKVQILVGKDQYYWALIDIEDGGRIFHKSEPMTLYF